MATGEFLSKLRAEDINGGREWRLLEDFAYVTAAGEEVVVPSGFVWNGASIPRLLWRAFGSPYCGRHRRPSVLHDYLWEQAKRQAAGKWSVGERVVTYRFANYVFWESMLAAGEHPVMAWLKWAGTGLNSSFRRGGWR